MTDNQDPYIVLGVAYGTAVNDTKLVYRKLALQYHPDKAGPDFTSRFQQIQAAWEKIQSSHLHPTPIPQARPSQFRSPQWGTQTFDFRFLNPTQKPQRDSSESRPFSFNPPWPKNSETPQWTQTRSQSFNFNPPRISKTTWRRRESSWRHPDSVSFCTRPCRRFPARPPHFDLYWWSSHRPHGRLVPRSRRRRFDDAGELETSFRDDLNDDLHGSYPYDNPEPSWEYEYPKFKFDQRQQARPTTAAQRTAQRDRERESKARAFSGQARWNMGDLKFSWVPGEGNGDRDPRSPLRDQFDPGYRRLDIATGMWESSESDFREERVDEQTRDPDEMDLD